MDKVETSQYFGTECDSDDEIEEDESDAEYFSDDQVIRKTIDYDLDKMFEIVKKRDFHNWSLNTIHNHYTKIDGGPTGRMQLTRYCFSFACNINFCTPVLFRFSAIQNAELCEARFDEQSNQLCPIERERLE